MERCQGSHMRCPGCGCPCHGGKRDDTAKVTVSGTVEPTAPVVVVLNQQAEAGETEVKGAARKPLDIAPRSSEADLIRKRRKKILRPGKRDGRPRADLPEEEINARFSEGDSVSALAREYEVDRRTINRVLGRGDMRSPTKPPTYTVAKALHDELQRQYVAAGLPHGGTWEEIGEAEQEAVWTAIQLLIRRSVITLGRPKNGRARHEDTDCA